MVKHNNVIPNQHFHKQWARRVKTWFDQPAKKKARRAARQLKAARSFPRPVDLLRPAVPCQTVQYNMRRRAGRGFTAAELKAANVSVHEALSIGIAVDGRRRNKSEETRAANVQRLKAYLDKLVFAKKATGRIGAAAAAGAATSIAAALPIAPVDTTVTFAKITDADKATSAHLALRELFNKPRIDTIRAKKAGAAEGAVPAAASS